MGLDRLVFGVYNPFVPGREGGPPDMTRQRPRPQARLRTAIRMALDRAELLRGPGLSPAAREITRQELSALSWLLELAGYPPTRYTDLDAPDAPVLLEVVLGTKDTNTGAADAVGAGAGTVSWEIGDIVGPTKHARRHHPFTFCLVRPNPGVLSPCVLYGRRILGPSTSLLALATTKITWPVEKIGRWQGPVAEIAVPDTRDEMGSTGVELPQFAPSEFAVGDYIEAVRERKGKRDIQPALYLITRLGARGLVGRLLYGRRVIRQTGEVTGPEIQITWRVRKATNVPSVV